MKLQWLMALLALSVFFAFVGIIAVRVGRIDLSTVILIGMALAGYDVFSQLFRRRLR